MVQRSLRDILKDAEHIDWQLALYLPKDVPAWNLDALAIIEDPDDIDSDDPDDDPENVKNAGYRYVMGIQSLQSIVSHAKFQLNNVSDEYLFKCFIFYFKNDAFIK